MLKRLTAWCRFSVINQGFNVRYILFHILRSPKKINHVFYIENIEQMTFNINITYAKILWVLSQNTMNILESIYIIHVACT